MVISAKKNKIECLKYIKIVFIGLSKVKDSIDQKSIPIERGINESNYIVLPIRHNYEVLVYILHSGFLKTKINLLRSSLKIKSTARL